MPDEHVHPGEPEYLGDAPVGSAETAPRRSRKGLAAAAAAAGVLGVVAVGGWAAVSLMSSGDQPAAAVPASALGYVSIDLDPSAGQKIEALRIAKKFPGLDEELGLEAQDDLRAWVFEKLQEESVCEDLAYDTDIAPWIGDRLAVAAVPTEEGDGEVVPLVALQVTDQEAAEKGIAALAECSEAPDDFGVAFTGEYALISDGEERATAFATAAEEASLADDEDFVTWTGEVGDPGIMTMYAAEGAMGAMLDLQDEVAGDLSADLPPGERAAFEEMQQMTERVREMYDGFGAMAAVVRFADGAMEAEFASAAMPEDFSWAASPDKATRAGDLPADTAGVYSVAFPDGWLDGYLETMGTMLGEQVPLDQVVAELEAQIGLSIPEDVEALVGESLSLAVSRDLDLEAAEHDPAAVPAGLRITGDTAEITGVLDKIRASLGPDGDMMVVEEGDGVVAVGLDADYAAGLVGTGTLGDEARFQDAVPDADRSAAVMYLDLDAVHAWVEQGMALGDGPDAEGREVLDNLEPFTAFGVGTWMDDDGSSHGRFRVTTD